MATDTRTCRCSTQPEPCTHMPTQEDLLCDHCRVGCGLVAVFAGKSVHMNNTGELDCTERMQALIGALPAEGGVIYPDLGTYQTREG